jgi:DNA replication and repair protein RecF
VYLSGLYLFNFKNYEEASLAFSPGINCLVGLNGSGKTNLLDAIHYLSMTRSFLNPADHQNIRTLQKNFIVKGDFDRAGSKRSVVASYQTGAKKSILEDGTECKKFSDHIGKYPLVLVTPQDIELIWGGSEKRRSFFDSLLSQMDKKYLEHLIRYHHFLKQRNGALRIFQERQLVDEELMARYNAELVTAGEYITNGRRDFLKNYTGKFQAHYRQLIHTASENVTIVYESKSHDSLAEALRKSLKKDLALGRTTVGIHRDDFQFMLDGEALKRFGSQGQQKSFLIGLKLAEFDSLTDALGVKPILLLDDIFDKLDDERIEKLLNLIANGHFGQLFITDARPERTEQLLSSARLSANVIRMASRIS